MSRLFRCALITRELCHGTAFAYSVFVITFATINLSEMLEKEFQYYLDNQDDLVKKYNGKYLVIKDTSVVGVYDDEDVAYFDAVEKYGLGNFILQLCTPGEEAYTIHIYTPQYSI